MRRKRRDKNTFTKRAVKALLIIGVINSEIPYILAAFGKETGEAIALAWITEIVGVMGAYMCKSYFETKQERKQNLEDYKTMEADNEQRIST